MLNVSVAKQTTPIVFFQYFYQLNRKTRFHEAFYILINLECHFKSKIADIPPRH